MAWWKRQACMTPPDLGVVMKKQMNLFTKIFTSLIFIRKSKKLGQLTAEHETAG